MSTVIKVTCSLLRSQQVQGQNEKRSVEEVKAKTGNTPPPQDRSKIINRLAMYQTVCGCISKTGLTQFS